VRSAKLAWWLALLQCGRLLWTLHQRAALAAIPARPEGGGTSAPPVSVVVPARNEALTIGECLTAARRQRYPELEIVVVDDCSEDQTAAIVRTHAASDRRVSLIEGAPLPPGWIGKSWALHQGARAAGGEWLLFVDADTRLRPGGVAGAVAEARRRGASMLSVFTGQELVTLWERIVQPAVFGALAEAVPMALINNPRLPGLVLANGQFMLLHRDAYRTLGGHAAIRGQISDDSLFARRAKQLGLRYWLGDGRELATTRMYRTPAGLWEGWTKNLHVGARLLSWLVVPGMLFQAATALAPFVCLYRAARGRSPSLALAGALQLAAAIGQRRAIDAFLGVPPAYSLLQPVGQLAFLLLALGSFGRVLTRRGVTWKGRRYFPTLTGADG
jgi:chlorobactene glucosyltransferase